jgi:2-hydroxy-6-oxonona-2,4-dienedioate hydrolase/4,5:9,10-diseco-3-hydroxy-5,9,17-trioxoandrosta-1(10),2-diene-4-oate hydrolase
MSQREAPESRFVKAGEIKIHYLEGGSGYPLICLHGGGPGAGGWSNFKGNFEAFSRHYRTFLADLPQFGKSDKPMVESNWLAFSARVFRDFMDALKIPKAHFIGNSMGGQVAIKLAIDYPERVDRLVVIGSTPVKSTIFQPMPLEAIRNIFSYYQGEGPSPVKMRQLIESLVHNHAFINAELIQERYEASVAPELIKLFKDYFPPLEDLYAELDKVKAKALIVWGQDDRAGALDVGLLMLRRFQDARLYIFSKCGHWAQVEHRDEFNRVVMEFLKG